MKPVTQTVFGYPHGNCHAACLASILELPIESMPVIIPGSDFWGVWEEHLNSIGYASITFQINELQDGFRVKGWHILGGKSPRGLFTEEGKPVYHSVVGRDQELIHDPHPDGTFFGSEKVEQVTILYRLDPK
jgi:hypothetical protein